MKKIFVATAICTTVFASLTLGLSARASGTLSLGSPSGNITREPFETNTAVSYQQLYSSSLFTAPITISEISFIDDPQFTGSAGNDVTVSLGTTTVTGLSTDLTDNGTLTQVYTGEVTQAVTWDGIGGFSVGDETPVTITLASPYTYNPSDGNLLLDLEVGPEFQSPTYDVVFDFLSTTSPGIASVGPNSTDTGEQDFASGLYTELTETPAPTPEPSSIVSVAAGTLLLAGLIVLKRKRTVRSLS